MVTPTPLHYVRNHFALPAPPGELVVDGAVRTPLRLALDDIRALRRRTLMVTLECAGNGRAFVKPPAPGEQWNIGAVSNAEWAGASLHDVLERAGPLASAVEVLFVGADQGTPKDLGRNIAFERSLPIADALGADVLLAYEMNGAPLTPEHGAPLRLVVPGWYGMASVKWLSRIALIEAPFRGFYQHDRYVIEGRPLREIAPRAVITHPVDAAEVRAGRLDVRGYAWSGRDAITGVQVSRDGGAHWLDASLGGAPSRYAWREWHLAIDAAPGELALVPRALTRGGAQPLEPVWNALGYANNGARPVRIRVA